MMGAPLLVRLRKLGKLAGEWMNLMQIMDVYGDRINT